MKAASRLRRRTRQITLTMAAATAVLAGVSTAAAAPQPQAQTEARTATAALPDTCQGLMHRTHQGTLARYVYEGSSFTRIPVGVLSFNGVVETPKTLALVRESEDAAVYMAVRPDGSLWRIEWDGETVELMQMYARGWSGVRHITASPSGTMLYALTTSGGLHRYAVTPSLTLKSLGAVATTGWGAVKFLSPVFTSERVDGLIGVISTSGALHEYEIDRVSGQAGSSRVFASGWGQMRHVSVGSVCSHSQGVSMMGFHENNNVYGYYDRNAFTSLGSDISGVGQVGRGFSGLLTD